MLAPHATICLVFLKGNDAFGDECIKMPFFLRVNFFSDYYSKMTIIIISMVFLIIIIINTVIAVNFIMNSTQHFSPSLWRCKTLIRCPSGPKKLSTDKDIDDWRKGGLRFQHAAN